MLKGGAILTFLVAIASVVLVLFNVLNDPETTGPVLLTLINANILLVMLFALYIGRKLVLMFLERRGRLRRSRLPLRFLGIFSVLAVMPALLVAGYALYMLNQGLETWFSQKVTQALEGSLQVAQAYLDEHEKALLIEAQALAKDPNIAAPNFLLDPLAMQEILLHEQELRGLDELSLYDNDGILISSSVKAKLGATDLFTMLSWDDRQPKALTDYNERRVIALAPVEGGSWLLTSRGIHPSVVARMDETEEAYKEYYGLLKDRGRIRLVFTLFLLVLVFATLAGAIWAGLRLANRIVKPVTELVHATNKVSAGDLDARLTPHDDDEMGILTQSFNRMTQQLKNNRTLVEKKNRELDNRRRTMEAVLTGVSAGVIALTPQGAVQTANRIARESLNLQAGKGIEVLPQELRQMFEAFMQKPQDLLQQQIRLEREGETKTLLVRMVPQWLGVGKIAAVIVTFDDITPLLSAQKVAAWSDVARRLAHEIKNPLTPIQLSAERLRRKYTDKIDTENRELFQQLTETIVHQTEEMRRMLNEFSDFARMPTPVFQQENLLDILDEVILLEKTARANIVFKTDYKVPQEEATFICDKSHINRIITNVLENSINAINEREGKKLPTGEIKIVVKMSQDDRLSVTVLDNGRGLPEDVAVDQLFDPYITTRKQGTGLGLAIVRRVMDEHGGQIKLSRRSRGGTSVELVLPKQRTEATDEPKSGVAQHAA
jgi:two-component system nitrogen regulation sensor histidine kinase NtrY